MGKAGVILMAALTVLLAGCAGPSGEKGGGLFGGIGKSRSSVDVRLLPPLRVSEIDVQVPRDLKVSEADAYKPPADIVWREDPFGDRHAQVQKIMAEAVAQGVEGLNGTLPVVVHVVLRRFHAVTERTRYTIGGQHEISFFLSATDARSGDEIIPPYLVKMRFRAYGGARALAAERMGITQKKRIIAHVAARIREELTGRPAPLVPEPDPLALSAGASAEEGAQGAGQGAGQGG